MSTCLDIKPISTSLFSNYSRLQLNDYSLSLCKCLNINSNRKHSLCCFFSRFGRDSFINNFQLGYVQNMHKNTIHSTKTVNTHFQPRINFFKYEVLGTFESQNISLTNQQLRKASGE